MVMSPKVFPSQTRTGSALDLLKRSASPSRKLIGFFSTPAIPIVISMFILVSIPLLGYLYAFSGIGYGVWTYTKTAEHSMTAAVCFVTALLMAFTLYVCDCDFWINPKLVGLRSVLSSAILVLLFATGLFSAGDYPTLPLLLFMIFVPFWLLTSQKLIKMSCCDQRFNFFEWLPVPLALCAFVCLLGWVVWITHLGNQWTPKYRSYISVRVRCDPSFDVYPDCDEDYFDTATGIWNCSFAGFRDMTWWEYTPDGGTRKYSSSWDEAYWDGGEDAVRCPSDCDHVYDSCLDAFLLWSMPLNTSIYYITLAFVCYLLCHANPRTQKEGQRHTPQSLMKVFLELMGAVILLIWIGASLAVANAGVTNYLMSFVLACCVAGGIMAQSFMGRHEAQEHFLAMLERFQKKYSNSLDWARAFMLLMCAPVVPFYCLLSFSNQAVRQCRLGCSKRFEDEDERLHWLTKGDHDKFHYMIEKWDWTSVINKALWIGVGIQVMFVLVTKLVYVFVAWLKDKLSSEHFLMVTLIILIVGLILFLLPPVPGVPIYFMGGIVLISSGKSDMGIPGSFAYTCAVGLGLKLVACTTQQKLIGERMKQQVWIRQLVGVNSKLIRTMRLILNRPGLSLAKVTILVGGPDWPTSVLCGILGLDLLPILLGTVPVIFLIMPTTLSGTLFYLAGPCESDGDDEDCEISWAGTMATVALSLTGMAQGITMLGFAYYVGEGVRDPEVQKELEAMPYDLAVQEADERAAVFRKSFDRYTAWPCLPSSMRILLVSALAMMTISVDMVLGFPSYCFVPFSLTGSIKEDLDGKPISVVKQPWGWIAIVFFMLATVLLQVYNSWATKFTKRCIACEKNELDIADINDIGGSSSPQGEDHRQDQPDDVTPSVTAKGVAALEATTQNGSETVEEKEINEDTATNPLELDNRQSEEDGGERNDDLREEDGGSFGSRLLKQQPV